MLPLVSIGGVLANAYLADGITNELASALSRVPGVQVVSPSRAAAMLAAEKSPSDVGRELAGSRQLEGTVQREGKRLRVAARLVNVQDGVMAWSDMYERDATDLLSVQEELARVITSAVREAIGAAAVVAESTTAPAGQASNAAYDLDLRGRYQLGRRGAEPLRQAISFFQQAAAKDPGFAPAFSGLAEAWTALQRASQLDVASPSVASSLAVALAPAGRTTDALAAAAGARRTREGPLLRDGVRALADLRAGAGQPTVSGPPAIDRALTGSGSPP